MNTVLVSGNLADNPKVNVVKDTLKVCNFSLAVRSEGKTPVTEFYDFVAWNKTAELIGSLFVKGANLAVRGRLKKEGWVDKKTNAKVTKMVISVDEVLNLPQRSSAPAAQVDVSVEEPQYQDSITF